MTEAEVNLALHAFWLGAGATRRAPTVHERWTEMERLAESRGEVLPTFQETLWTMSDWLGAEP